MSGNVDLLQTVGWYYHPIEAEIAKGMLESMGFNPFLHSQNHAWANWTLCIALGGIRLQVPHWQAQEAIEVLSLPELKNENDTCSACGSSDTTLLKTRWKVSFLVFHFTGIPLPFSVEKRSCLDCGQQWQER